MALMAEYALYLESGPRRQKTMVHVLDLLGCTVPGATTEAALEATPEAIRMFLAFLKRHGEDIDPDATFTTKVAVHVIDRVWPGNGDPTAGFAPDFQPLSTADLATYRQRLAWMRADLLDLIRGLTQSELLAKPPSGGRSIHHILHHVADSDYAYLRVAVGPVEGLPALVRAVEQSPAAAGPALSELWQRCDDRLAAMTEAERTRTVQHGQKSATARRYLRRMLEHQWEHLQEISRLV
jgi:uncharacterized damage-inducible protein DinB/predicted RNase H-like HicB family nuclease